MSILSRGSLCQRRSDASDLITPLYMLQYRKHWNDFGAVFVLDPSNKHCDGTLDSCLLHSAYLSLLLSRSVFEIQGGNEANTAQVVDDIFSVVAFQSTNDLFLKNVLEVFDSTLVHHSRHFNNSNGRDGLGNRAQASSATKSNIYLAHAHTHTHDLCANFLTAVDHPTAEGYVNRVWRLRLRFSLWLQSAYQNHCVTKYMRNDDGDGDAFFPMRCLHSSQQVHNSHKTLLEASIATARSSSRPRVAFITAIIGSYEASCKAFAIQTVDADFICFCPGNPNVTSNGWIVDSRPYHLDYWANVSEHMRAPLFINGSRTALNSAPNTFWNNQNPYFVHLFYKVPAKALW